MSCISFSLVTVKIGPASCGEFSLFFFYVSFHVFLVFVLAMCLIVTSINFATGKVLAIVTSLCSPDSKSYLILQIIIIPDSSNNSQPIHKA